MGVEKREAAWRKWRRMSEEDVRGRKRGHVGNVKEDER